MTPRLPLSRASIMDPAWDELDLSWLEETPASPVLSELDLDALGAVPDSPQDLPPFPELDLEALGAVPVAPQDTPPAEPTPLPPMTLRYRADYSRSLQREWYRPVEVQYPQASWALLYTPEDQMLEVRAALRDMTSFARRLQTAQTKTPTLRILHYRRRIPDLEEAWTQWQRLVHSGLVVETGYRRYRLGEGVVEDGLRAALRRHLTAGESG